MEFVGTAVAWAVVALFVVGAVAYLRDAVKSGGKSAERDIGSAAGWRESSDRRGGEQPPR